MMHLYTKPFMIVDESQIERRIEEMHAARRKGGSIDKSSATLIKRIVNFAKVQYDDTHFTHTDIK